MACRFVFVLLAQSIQMLTQVCIDKPNQFSYLYNIDEVQTG